MLVDVAQRTLEQLLGALTNWRRRRPGQAASLPVVELRGDAARCVLGQVHTGAGHVQMKTVLGDSHDVQIARDGSLHRVAQNTDVSACFRKVMMNAKLKVTPYQR